MENLLCPRCQSKTGYKQSDYALRFHCPACGFTCFMKHYRAILKEQAMKQPKKRLFSIKRINGLWIISDRYKAYKSLDEAFEDIRLITLCI